MNPKITKTYIIQSMIIDSLHLFDSYNLEIWNFKNLYHLVLYLLKEANPLLEGKKKKRRVENFNWMKEN